MIDATLPEAPRRTPYVGRVRSGFDKASFLVFTGIGAAGIIGLKLLGYPQVIVTLFPIGVMIVYALILFFSPRLQLRDDQAGDNVYYLGFLYTLVSLAYALFVFTPEVGASHLIGNFGIALATTILGLTLRVFFNQMRQDPVEVEREARLELAEVASRLRSELDQVILDMNHFRRATQQSIAEGFEAVLEKASEGMAQSAERFEEAATAMVVKLGEAFEAFTANSNRLNEISENVVAAIELLLDRVEKIEAPSDLLTTKLEPAVEAIRQAGEEVKKRARGDERQLAKLTKALETSITGAENLATHVEALGSAAKRAEADIAMLGKQARDNQAIQAELLDVVSNAQRLVEQQASALRAMQDGMESLTGGLSSIAAAWQREAEVMLEQIMTKGAAAREQVARDLAAAQADQHLAMQQLSEVLAQTVRTVQGHARELEKELETSRRHTQQVHRALVDMTGELVRRLTSAEEETRSAVTP